MEFHHHYLGWDRPFTLSLADKLRATTAPDEALDEWMIWLPSSRAGRHLLSELFTGRAEATEAFHPPHMITPAQFIRSLPGSETDASEARKLLAWKSVIYRIRTAEIAALFPVVPTRQKHQWSYALAEQLIRLRARLLEDNHDFASVAKAAPGKDRERWVALARIEGLFLEELQGLELTETGHDIETRLEAVLKLMPFRRLLVAGVLNLSKRQITCIEGLAAKGVAVEFYLPVPGEEASLVDEWGRPVPDQWAQKGIPGELLEGVLQRSAEPRELVDRVLDLTDVYQDKVEALVMGAPDPEVGKYLVERSRLTRTPVYMPEGKALSATSWGRLLRLIAKSQESASMSDLLELLRHSLFRKWVTRNSGNVDQIEHDLLILLKERLITDTRQLTDPAFKPISEIGTARSFLKLVEPLFLADDAQHLFPERIWQILQSLATGTGLSDEAKAVLGQLEEILADLKADFHEEQIREEDYWEILNYLLQSRHYYPEREAEERPVSGWLELPWERAPHLVILGLPDKQVPGSDGTETFLTPALCHHLGIYGPDEAAAFHAMRLRMILENRKEWGKLDILLPDRGLDDDPELASRFLFLSEDDDILQRVDLLLSERSSPENAIPATFGTHINLPQPPERERVSVTDFSAYLYSPLHYLMERSFKWGTPRELPVEMDALRFGKLAHSVLEKLNGTDESAGLSSLEDVEAFMNDQLSTEMGREFGQRLSVPVIIQESGLRERLRAAATIISTERQAGWKPVKSEWRFTNEIDFFIGGLRLSGVIDLVEKNEESGLYRVIDYKSSDSATEAIRAHLIKINVNSPEPWFPECDFEEDGKAYRWKDLQLILYYLAVEKAMEVRPMVGYFNLAKAVKEVGISQWVPSETHVSAALKCAEGVVERIREGSFPVGPSTRYKDDWLPWFGSDYMAGIDPAWRERHMEVES
jgi:ATP-dependent helicase/nuclease subunit B